ncbi:MAG: hypothetical protein PHS16_00735 [Candidatus Colwellbacteria bacterium]|nr:hypothetical protein [Candidatus Colwellbacteria bacterium]MDD4818675.1 hypothetical protein [Candidatus Colwellbacteria bacterium]
MKKSAKICFSCILLVCLFFSTSIAYAEEENSSENNGEQQSVQDEVYGDSGLNVNIGVIGNEPNVNVGVQGNNPKVNVDVDGEGSEVYINDRNINIPTEVHNHNHNSYTTVVEGVTISQVTREIDKNLSPLSSKTQEIEGNLGVAIDGLSKVILMLGDPNHLESTVVDSLNAINSDLSGIKGDISSIISDMEKVIGYLEELNKLVEESKTNSLKRDKILDSEILKIQKELESFSKWSADIAEILEKQKAKDSELSEEISKLQKELESFSKWSADIAEILEKQKAKDSELSEEISKLQKELQKFSEWSESIVELIKSDRDESVERDNQLLSEITQIKADMEKELKERDEKIASLEKDREILIIILISFGAALVITIIATIIVKARKARTM